MESFGAVLLAAVIGCAVGFALGVWTSPRVEKLAEAVVVHVTAEFSRVHAKLDAILAAVKPKG